LFWFGFGSDGEVDTVKVGVVWIAWFACWSGRLAVVVVVI
jgi:hypothetical protein